VHAGGALIILFTKYVKKMPGYIAALFVGTVIVAIFKLPVETIGTKFGGILILPHSHVDVLRPLMASAITVVHVRRYRVADIWR